MLLLITEAFTAPAYDTPDVRSNSRSQYSFFHGDGTYKFGYNTGTGTFHKEEAQPQGGVTGQFGFVDALGNNVEQNYEAGSQGYIITSGNFGAKLNTDAVQPEAPKAPVQNYEAPKQSYEPPQQSYEAPQPSYEAPQQSYEAPQQSYEAPVQTYEENAANANMKMDASYSLEYETPDSSRKESSDSDGNVSGFYQYTNDGQVYRIDYEAGADKGFVATGDHIPLPVEANAGDFGAKITPVQTPVSAEQNTYDNSLAVETSYAPPVQNMYDNANTVSSQSSFNSGTSSANNYEHADISFILNDDGSYSYAYQSPSLAQSQTADAQNEVSGSYTYTDVNGLPVNVQYFAGKQGFVPSGTGIPEAPKVNVAPSTGAVNMKTSHY